MKQILGVKINKAKLRWSPASSQFEHCMLKMTRVNLIEIEDICIQRFYNIFPTNRGSGIICLYMLTDEC